MQVGLYGQDIFLQSDISMSNRYRIDIIVVRIQIDDTRDF